MEGELSSIELAEDLVENIIAWMPFPSIFKARTLSKAWLARFSSSVESHEGDHGEAKISRAIAARFQKLVSERSSTWEISGPVCIGHDHDECHAGKAGGKEICSACYAENYAYNRERQTWQKIPSMSFIPSSSPLINRRLKLTMDGALAFLPRDEEYYVEGPRDSSKEELYVANILTRNWRLLPSRPGFEGKEKLILLAKIVNNPSSQTYKVVLFVKTFHWGPSHIFNGRRSADSEFCVQIYDSMSCSWRSKKLIDIGEDHNYWSRFDTAVYLNGVLYMVAGLGATRLVAFDMEEENLIDLSIGDGDRKIHGRYLQFIERLVVCDDELFIICSKKAYGVGSDLYLRVVKVDLSLRTLSVVAEGPPRILNLKSDSNGGEPVAYAGFIYSAVVKESIAHSVGQIAVYNVRENSWSVVHWCPDGFYTGCCFQPGLNPFVAP